MAVPEWLTARPFAHRGLFDNESTPENSLAAFELAIGGGHPIELDVRMTRDGVLGVFHDMSLLRMTFHNRLFKACDWSSISDLKLLRTGETVPRLETALEVIGGRIPILVEIKNESLSNKVSAVTAEVLGSYAGPFAVQSFNVLTVSWFKKHKPEYCCGQLARGLRWKSAPARAINSLLGSAYLGGLSKPDFISFDIKAGDIEFFQRIRRKSKAPLLLWTVNSEEKLEMCKKLGVNYIFEKNFVDTAGM